MIDSLFDKKTEQQFEHMASKIAKTNKKAQDLVDKCMQKLNAATIIDTLDVVDMFGHPQEIDLSKKLRNKYEQGQDMDFDDIMTIRKLYKSNYSHFKEYKNKGDINE